MCKITQSQVVTIDGIKGGKRIGTCPHENQKPKDNEGDQIEDKLLHIQSKVKGYDIVLKEIKDNVSTLNRMVTSHSSRIRNWRPK